MKSQTIRHARMRTRLGDKFLREFVPTNHQDYVTIYHRHPHIGGYVAKRKG